MPSATAASPTSDAARFVHAQAVATWQAMVARRRDRMLVVLDRLEEVGDVLSAVHGLVRAA